MTTTTTTTTNATTAHRCVIDRNVLNKKTISSMEDLALSVFASLCGRNRGAFVLDPPDGQTYSCLNLPTSFAETAGIDITTSSSSDVTINDTTAITDNLVNGTITPSTAVKLLDLLCEAVYQSTANVDKDPYACNVNGLAELQCSTTSSLSSPLNDGDTSMTTIRSVNLAGLIVPELWATGGKALSLEQAKDFYTVKDFEDMKEFGLNAVQIKVDDTLQQDDDVQHVLGHVLDMVHDAGLQAIVALVNTKDTNVIASVAAFCESDKAVLAMILPKVSHAVKTARSQAPTLPLLIPITGGDLLDLQVPGDDANVYAALDMSHSSTVADIASSNSVDDRSKLFYHESLACTYRSPIEYAKCHRGVPIFISGGFDLSNDDCIHQGDTTTLFRDYGQCDRFEETVDSDWWHRHRASFAARQLVSFERGLGWSFATWKLYNDHPVGVMNKPAKLLALKDVAAAGLFPSLHKKMPASLACLNPPEPDFTLGDDTLAPTLGPPPDCGDGWWNYNTSACEYWIPPTPSNVTNATTPSEAPPCEPCSTTRAIISNNKALLITGAGVAFVVGILVGNFLVVLFGGGRRGRRNEGYEAIPS